MTGNTNDRKYRRWVIPTQRAIAGTNDVQYERWAILTRWAIPAMSNTTDWQY